jgi:hypothetical protein
MRASPDGDEAFDLLEQSGEKWARIRFDGPFQGTQVTWEVTVMTLAHHAGGLPRDVQGRGLRQHIDVAPVKDGRGQITVVLALPRIDLPALRKTVIMVRQWKRLGPGRHEYGPVQRLD